MWLKSSTRQSDPLEGFPLFYLISFDIEQISTAAFPITKPIYFILYVYPEKRCVFDWH